MSKAETTVQAVCELFELDRDSSTIAVGDVIDRFAASRGPDPLEVGLDSVSWVFDRSADEPGGAPEVVALRDSGWLGRIRGRVTRVQAIYVTMTLHSSRGPRVLPGSIHLEDIQTTGNTRRPEQYVEWQIATPPDADGHVVLGGFGSFREGDEDLRGWLITLDDAQLP